MTSSVAQPVARIGTRDRTSWVTVSFRAQLFYASVSRSKTESHSPGNVISVTPKIQQFSNHPHYKLPPEHPLLPQIS